MTAFVATFKVELAHTTEQAARGYAQAWADTLFEENAVLAISCSVEAGTLADQEETT